MINTLVLKLLSLIFLYGVVDCQITVWYENCSSYLNVWDTYKHPQLEDKLLSDGALSEDSVVILFATALWQTFKADSVAYDAQASALTLAFDDACNTQLVYNKTFDLVFMNDQCKPYIGLRNTIKVRHLIDVILGLPCSQVTKNTGYYLRYWNIPLISYASSDAAISNKKTYPTVIRMGATYKQIGQAFVEVFKAFKWKTASVFTRDYGLCLYGGQYVLRDFKANGLYVAEYWTVDLDVTKAEMRRFLVNFKERARILFVCLPNNLMNKFMEIAYDEGMVTPEYVYLTFQLNPDATTTAPWGNSVGLSEAELQRKKAIFKHMKTLTPSDTTGENNLAFRDLVAEKLPQHPWYINLTQELGTTGSPYSVIVYDSMWFYLMALNESQYEGQDPSNGTYIFDKARNRIFQGRTTEVILDGDADRIPNYWLWHLRDGTDDEFKPFAALRMISEEGKRVQLGEIPFWGTEDGLPPPDKPACGYRNELCPPSTANRDTALIGGFSAAAIVIILTFSGFIYYRRKKFEDDLQKMTWKILYDDIEFSSKKKTASSTGMSVKSQMSLHSEAAGKSTGSMSVFSKAPNTEQIFTQVGYYKGVVCAIKSNTKTDYKLTRQDLIDLKLMKDMNHENLNGFIGACIKSPEIIIVSQYCSKGSLQDILENDEIQLDWMFKSSIINDLINGMSYLHGTELASHGHLKSGSCLIDGRWALKIANYGLHMLKSDKEGVGKYEKYRDQLWTAPELLRADPATRPPKGTPKGDVYSFSIILQEILFRALPYFMDNLSPKEIIKKVKLISENPYRPEVPVNDREIDPKMIQLMKDCWDENPAFRPDFGQVKKKLLKINKGKKINIMDNMVAKLEKYANNLEDIVEKRTEELVIEKKKTDMLLYRMLPSVVAEKLKNGQGVPPEMFESVTIYFSDVVGFTSISSDSTPMQVVDLLNDLYTMFDDIIAKHDVYKVETIGDAYMCVSGLPKKNGDRHAAEIANMSLELRHNVKMFTIRHLPERPMKIRIGLHSGACAAGVVGLTMPRYCLFGDTVNVASRMESNGEAMKIHISQTTCTALDKIGGYSVSLRGQVDLKGKGSVTSYWLDGKEGDIN